MSEDRLSQQERDEIADAGGDISYDYVQLYAQEIAASVRDFIALEAAHQFIEQVTDAFWDRVVSRCREFRDGVLLDLETTLESFWTDKGLDKSLLAGRFVHGVRAQLEVIDLEKLREAVRTYFHEEQLAT